MDASSYLKRHGWRGDGHSLDHTGKGIKKPLLVSKKVDVLGVGLSKHTALSDQWWLKAFDSALKDIGTGKQSMLSNVQKHGVNNGDLYGRFVKGEGMAGTIGDSISPSSTGTPVAEVAAAVAVGGKRKRGDDMQEESRKAAKLGQDGMDRKVKRLMRDAVRCGMIPPSAREVEKGVMIGSRMPRNNSELSKFVSATEFKSQDVLEDAAKREKARRDFKRAAKRYYSDEPAKLQGKRTDTSKGIPPEKLAEYSRRAQAKGMSVEAYIKRREEKNAAKKTKASSTDDCDDLNFVVDVTGDPTLATRKTNAIPANFSKLAIDGISAGELTVITNDAGDEIFNWHPGMAIPLDPRIWEGAEVKQLPKPIRKARQLWMAEKREARKAKKASTTSTAKVSKPEKKTEAREAFVEKLLRASRKAPKTGEGKDLGSVDIDGHKGVPLVVVQSTEGAFGKDDVALARTVARRYLRDVKRKEKAARGKGKGSKKTKKDK